MNARPTALIAEDEPLLREALVRQLAEAWPELEVVAEARNGREAVESFEQLRPDICFLDVHMPEANSMEVIELMQHRSPGTRYVSYTGDQDTALGAEAFRRGASDFLRKPIQVGEVIAAANAAFAAGDRARETGRPVLFGS